MSKVIIRLPKVTGKTGLDKSAIYRGIKNGTFPAPVSIGPRSVGWIESEIDSFIESRIEASRSKKQGGAQ